MPHAAIAALALTLFVLLTTLCNHHLTTGFAAGPNNTKASMYFHFAANAVLLFHLAFIVFAVLGAALAFRWRWVPYVHLPAAAWAFFVEATGRICPLTYLENHLRSEAGQSGYSGGFIEHYLLPIIYPAGLTPSIQIWLAGVVIVVNAAIYALLWNRSRRP